MRNPPLAPSLPRLSSSIFEMGDCAPAGPRMGDAMLPANAGRVPLTQAQKSLQQTAASCAAITSDRRRVKWHLKAGQAAGRSSNTGKDETRAAQRKATPYFTHTHTHTHTH
eukprot:Opistho-1_new@65159